MERVVISTCCQRAISNGRFDVSARILQESAPDCETSALRCCRVDLVIRRALIAEKCSDTGITAYCTACGVAAVDARASLECRLGALADAILPARSYNESMGE